MKIKIKRTYDPVSEDDGYRVLVDRLWPRGISKENLKCDLWAKEISPSNELRKWYHEDMEGHREEFRTHYKKEIEESGALKHFREQISGKKLITLLYASKDTENNHAIFLANLLTGERHQ